MAESRILGGESVVLVPEQDCHLPRAFRKLFEGYRVLIEKSGVKCQFTPFPQFGDFVEQVPGLDDWYLKNAPHRNP